MKKEFFNSDIEKNNSKIKVDTENNLNEEEEKNLVIFDEDCSAVVNRGYEEILAEPEAKLFIDCWGCELPR